MTQIIESPRHPRILDAKQLQRRSNRQGLRRFLVEGRQAVSELVKTTTPYEIFVTEQAADRNADILEGQRLTYVSEQVAATLSETVTPQGLVAVAPLLDTELAIDASMKLIVVLVEARDPGNAGTVIRVADAAGADLVVFVGDSVDPHNGKCIRAAAGSHFHLPIAQVDHGGDLTESLRELGISCVGTAGNTPLSLDDLDDSGDLAKPTAWFFGNEAQGLPEAALADLDKVASIPIYGSAESLNLATAAAVCLYATARAQRRAYS